MYMFYTCEKKISNDIPTKVPFIIFVFFRLISCHVWVCVRGCWSLSTIYHSWMYRYLLHMIHLCIISYLHYTTRCAESKTMLKKMTELFYMLGVYYIQLPVVKRFLCRTWLYWLFIVLVFRWSSLPKYTQCPNTFRFPWISSRSNRH